MVTNQVTGQVSILRNQGDGTFTAPTVYRGGAGISSIDDSGGSPEVLSLEDTAGVAAGPLTPGGPTDLVTINPGSNTLDVLAGLGQGRFANPVALPTQEPARVIRMADFNHDGILDLAILTADGVEIELGNGHGGFLPPVAYDAGPDPGGLTIADINHDGNPDLLVSNPYGDLLVLLGQGNGTFQPYRNTNQTITLAVADLTGNGSKDVIYADPGLDRVVVHYGDGRLDRTGQSVHGPARSRRRDAGRPERRRHPRPDRGQQRQQQRADLSRPGRRPVRAGRQWRAWLLRRHQPGRGSRWPTSRARRSPTANLGSTWWSPTRARTTSRSCSIKGTSASRRATRLKPGGSGPVSTLVGYFTGGAYPDLLVTDSGSNDVRLLPGVGDGLLQRYEPDHLRRGDRPGNQLRRQLRRPGPTW